MPDRTSVPSEFADFQAWVDGAADDPPEQEIRRVIRIIVHAVSSNQELQQLMVIKGGVLLAAAYHTGRHTRDVDFSTSKLAGEVDMESLCEKLDEAVETSATLLDDSLDCRVQSKRLQPPGPDATYPTLRVRVGYAERGSKAHPRLRQGKSPHTVLVDLSFNESLGDPVKLNIEESGELRAYSLVDQVAEKYRAVIQQQSRYRTRERRQDAYDIYQVLQQGYLDSLEERRLLVRAIRTTCKSRGVSVSADAILAPEIRQRSRKEYNQLQDEIDGELVDFDTMFDRIAEFFAALPWDEV